MFIVAWLDDIDNRRISSERQAYLEAIICAIRLIIIKDERCITAARWLNVQGD